MTLLSKLWETTLAITFNDELVESLPLSFDNNTLSNSTFEPTFSLSLGTSIVWFFSTLNCLPFISTIAYIFILFIFRALIYSFIYDISNI